jgi:membrane protein DedA with SNARE-associated domain
MLRWVMVACALWFAAAIAAGWYLGHSGRSPIGSTIAGGVAGLAIAVALPVAVEMWRERRR